MTKKIVKGLLITLFWVGVWQLISMAVGIELLLPSPLKTLKRLFELSKTAQFYKTIGISILRIISGTAIAIFLGTVLATMSAGFKIIHDFISPLMTVIKAVPVASFIVLLLLWMGENILPSVISVLIVLPIVWSNVEMGILSTDKKLLGMARAYGMGKLKTIKYIYFPSVLPFFVSALNSSLGLSWKAGVAAEVLALPIISIGRQISESRLYLETTDLFAWTLTVIIISLIIERVIIWGIKKIPLGHMGGAV